MPPSWMMLMTHLDLPFMPIMSSCMSMLVYVCKFNMFSMCIDAVAIN